MSRIIVVFCVFLTSFCYSQKIKIKDGTVWVDGMEYLLVDKGRDGVEVNFNFTNLKGEDIAYAKGIEYYDPLQISSANKDGRMYFFQLSFEGIEGFCDIDASFNNQKKIADIIYSSKIVENDILNQDNAIKYLKRKGAKHSDRIYQMEEERRRRDEIELERAKSKDVIIIENTAPKPLININL